VSDAAFPCSRARGLPEVAMCAGLPCVADAFGGFLCWREETAKTITSGRPKEAEQPGAVVGEEVLFPPLCRAGSAAGTRGLRGQPCPAAAPCSAAASVLAAVLAILLGRASPRACPHRKGGLLVSICFVSALLTALCLPSTWCSATQP